MSCFMHYVILCNEAASFPDIGTGNEESNDALTLRLKGNNTTHIDEPEQASL